MTSKTAEPGSPRTGLSPRQRQRVGQGVQYVVIVGVIILVALIGDWDRLQQAFFKVELIPEMLPGLFTIALKNTIIYTLTGYVLGFFLGLLIAIMRLSSVALNRWIAQGYIEVFRGLPALLVFMLLGFGIPVAFPGYEMMFEPYGTVALALGLVSAAYMAETFRAGIQAVPKGQIEAARSLGMSSTRAMVTVVLPQAVRIVIPPLTNELVMLFKDSSLVYLLGLTASTSELAKFGRDFSVEHANSTGMVVAGLAYLIITVPLGYAVRKLEARQAKGR